MLKLLLVALFVSSLSVATEHGLKARFGDNVVESKRELFIYSVEAATKAEIKNETNDSWSELITRTSTENYFAFSTKSVVGASETSNFIVRVTTKERMILTWKITAKAHEDGRPRLSTELISEEKDESPVGFLETLRIAQTNIGNQVGGGGCNELCGNGGQEIGRLQDSRVTGDILPGSVLEMLFFSVTDTSNVTWRSKRHYAVVESYDPNTRVLTILHQNTQDGHASGRFVRRDHLRIDTLRGTFIVREGR